jgi:preprotein translocase subunit YajC
MLGDGMMGGATNGMSGSGALALLAQAAPSGPGGMFALGNILPILLMFGIFYIILIRPQQKRQRELQDWLKSIGKGDEVVTTGGLWGKVSSVSEKSPYVTLELQEKVRVRVLRSHIAGKAPANDSTGAAAPDATK